jgi:hypothetical protein
MLASAGLMSNLVQYSTGGPQALHDKAAPERPGLRAVPSSKYFVANCLLVLDLSLTEEISGSKEGP